MDALSFINILLILITVGFSVQGFSNEAFKERWVHKPYRVKHNKEWYRLFSSGFVHADWMHLLFNMLSLYFFGDYILYLFIGLGGLMGVVYYLLFYVSAIGVSGIADQRKYADSRGYGSLGASGAVSALIFAGILLYPLGEFYGIIPGFIFGPLYLWYCSYMSKRGMDHINHDAHYYGAIYGILVVILVYPTSVPAFFEQIFSWRFFN